MKKTVKVLLDAENKEGLEELVSVKNEYKNYIISCMKYNVDYLCSKAEEKEMTVEEYLKEFIKSNENISYYQDMVEEIYKLENVEKPDYCKQLKNKGEERNK